MEQLSHTFLGLLCAIIVHFAQHALQEQQTSILTFEDMNESVEARQQGAFPESQHKVNGIRLASEHERELLHLSYLLCFTIYVLSFRKIS